MCKKEDARILIVGIGIGLIVGVLLTFFVFDIRGIYNGTRALNFETCWTAVAAIAAALTLPYGVYTYKKDVEWRRKENALNAFPQLREKFGSQDKKISDLYAESQKDFDEKIQGNGITHDGIKEIVYYLAAMERFSCGVNQGLYDIHLVNEMSGNLLVTQYNKFFCFFIPNRKGLCTKVSFLDNDKVNLSYCAYEKLMRQLIKLQEKNEGRGHNNVNSNLI